MKSEKNHLNPDQ